MVILGYFFAITYHWLWYILNAAAQCLLRETEFIP